MVNPTVENAMKDLFKRIFQIQKATFDEPGDSEEQECIFIDMKVALPKVTDTEEIYKVTGEATVFGLAEKIHVGFFAKAIAQAEAADTKDLFIYDWESNTRRYRDKVQRGFSFIYFFKTQYDPDKGEITSITTEVSIGETA